MACLLLLGVLAFCFPKEGIALGNINLRFASIEDIWPSADDETEQNIPAIDPEEQLKIMAKALEMKQLSDLADSLHYYQHLLSSASSSIVFPRNDASLFDAFFAAMEQASQRRELVRVLHYGDSQIEQDRITSSLRGNWQQRFGGMGCGMVPAMQVVQTPYLKQEYSGQLQRYLVYGLPADRIEHRQYGPMAQFMRVTDSAQVLLTPRHYHQPPFQNRCNYLRVLVANASPDFQAVLNVDGQSLMRALLCPDSSLQMLEWKLDQALTQVDLTFWGSADIQAILLDGQYGVAVDNLPMRGCSGTIFTSIEKQRLQQAYAMLNPRLVILEFGGNSMPGISSQANIDNYVRYMASQIRYLKKILPQSAFLFIGPADMACSVEGEIQSYPYLEAMISALKEMCLANDVAFWDMYQVMGGRNSIIEWTKTQPPLAAPDYVHFTTRGARRIADLLNSSFNLCYDYYRFRQQHLDDSTMYQIQQLDSTQNYHQTWESMLQEARADSLLWQQLEGSLDSIQNMK